MIVSNILALKNEYDQNNVAVMIGAGLSMNADQKYGLENSFQNWDGVIKSLARDTWPDDTQEDIIRKCSIGNLLMADIICDLVGIDKFNELLKTYIPDDSHKPSRLHYDIFNMKWAEIFTTNQDTLIERSITCIDREDASGNSVISVWSNETFSLSTSSKDKTPVYKMHGCINHPESIVFAEKAYLGYQSEMPFLDMHLRASLCRRSFLYIGFGLSDPNFKSMLQFVLSHNGTDVLPRSYAIMYDIVDEHIIEYWRKRNLVIIPLLKDKYEIRLGLILELLKLETNALINHQIYRLLELRYLLSSFQKSGQSNNLAIMKSFDLYYFNSIMKETDLTMRIVDVFILLSSVLYGDQAHEFLIPSDIDIELSELEINIVAYSYYQGIIRESDIERLGIKATWQDFCSILHRFINVEIELEKHSIDDYFRYGDFYRNLLNIIEPWVDVIAEDIRNSIRGKFPETAIDILLLNVERIIREMYEA